MAFYNRSELVQQLQIEEALKCTHSLNIRTIVISDPLDLFVEFIR